MLGSGPIVRLDESRIKSIRAIAQEIGVFVMVLGYSRAIYVEFTNRCNIHAFIRCLIHGFEYFGGVTDIVLTDRMKTVILWH